MLADRGHEVFVAFESTKKQAEGLEALHGVERVHVLEPLPRRRDVWEKIAVGVRSTGDYMRYLHPDLAGATYLRRRMQKVLPRPMQPLARIRRLPVRLFRVLVVLFRMLEQAIPSSAQLERFMGTARPDVVLVSPLVTDASRQTDVVKAARALGIPTAVCVASWDHLTTKGLLRILPDLVFVWNETQREEARELHAVDAKRVVVTGAQPFDRWFTRRPSLDRDAFCRRVGLRASPEFLLFVGSTASISEPEAEERFVRAWVAALRACEAEELRDRPILIRPHPYNPGSWKTVEFPGLGPIAVWPRAGANPVNEADREDYFHSLYYSAAVVGINTSAMIEAAILGKPVHTVRMNDFRETQDLTVHFNYLLPEQGGFVRSSADLDDHIASLAATLAESGPVRTERDRFVSSFIRPHGVDRPATPILVDEIERLATRRVEPAHDALGTILRPPLYLAGVVAALASRQRHARAADRMTLVSKVPNGVRRARSRMRA
jgi:hypothetical protein